MGEEVGWISHKLPIFRNWENERPQWRIPCEFRRNFQHLWVVLLSVRVFNLERFAQKDPKLWGLISRVRYPPKFSAPQQQKIKLGMQNSMTQYSGVRTSHAVKGGRSSMFYSFVCCPSHF